MGQGARAGDQSWYLMGFTLAPTTSARYPASAESCSVFEDYTRERSASTFSWWRDSAFFMVVISTTDPLRVIMDTRITT